MFQYTECYILHLNLQKSLCLLNGWILYVLLSNYLLLKLWFVWLVVGVAVTLCSLLRDTIAKEKPVRARPMKAAVICPTVTAGR
jgi:hypothetical protein